MASDRPQLNVRVSEEALANLETLRDTLTVDGKRPSQAEAIMEALARAVRPQPPPAATAGPPPRFSSIPNGQPYRSVPSAQPVVASTEVPQWPVRLDRLCIPDIIVRLRKEWGWTVEAGIAYPPADEDAGRKGLAMLRRTQMFDGFVTNG
jgi:hypothetical protein